MLKRSTVVVLMAVCVLMVLVSSASAMTPAPGWEAFGRVEPTNLKPGGVGEIVIYVTNVGSASGEGAVLTNTLPQGVEAIDGAEELISGSLGRFFGDTCTGTTVVTCTLGSAIEPGENAYVDIPVKVANGLSGSAVDSFTVVGGGALESTEGSLPLTFSSSFASEGLAGLDAWFTNLNGTTDRQAGSSPYELTVAFAVNEAIEKESTEYIATNFSQNVFPVGGEMRNININLPPGIVGYPLAVPRCPRQVFELEKCPVSTQVGIDETTPRGIRQETFRVYNLVPPPGVAAQFAFDFAGIDVFLDSGVRTGGDNGITVHSDNLPERGIVYNSTTIWGVPAEESHDDQRGEGIAQNGEYCEEDCPAGVPAKPFLQLPTSCQGPLTFTARVQGTWEDENTISPLASAVTHNEKEEPVGITSCERLTHFEPSVSITPETSFADTPTGLSVKVRVPQEVNPDGLATSGLQNTTVTLPEGVVINPGQATGLQACQPSEEALGTEPDGEVNEKAASCPAASKVGTDEITTPLLTHPLKGNVYVLQSNPPSLQLLVTASGEGVNLKLVGTVHLNEHTGQLVTTFEKTPDIPFTEFTLSFSGGAQAALATPTLCGDYESLAQVTPWSAPFIEDAFSPSRFQITAGPNGTPCASPLPFKPTMTAGATTDQAGGYTDFTMLLQREDDQQRIGRLQFKTPEGLLGMIANVPLCQEPQAAQGTCSSASQIGHTVANAGPGPYPFQVPQAGAPAAPIYLTGPYDGAPFGLSIVVPVVAGPFNLGTVVIRGKIEVDPHTSRLTVTTGELPRILDGIPTDLRAIDAVIDRPNFMFNPTSCAPMSFSGTATSYEGTTAPLESHFQVGSCRALKFAPDFKVSTSGKTSRATGASLNVKIIYPTGNLGSNQASSQSNINSVKVDLPKQLPSQLKTLQKACPAATFTANPANCPPASIVGHAKAVTPVLPVPVEGPAYFVSHGGEAFPNLVVVLQGDNVTIELVGDTFINEKTDITSSTFKNIPDVPISLFELNLPQGKYPALAANGNLCKDKLLMPTAFTAQNGAVIHESTPVNVTGCPKAKKTKKPKAKSKKKSGKSKKK